MSLCINCQQETHNPKFCSISCAAKINNLGKTRNPKTRNYKCLKCSKDTTNPKFCSNLCCAQFNKVKRLENIIDLFDKGLLNDRSWIRKILIERFGNKCFVCEITEWNNKPITFWVDHIDGNASNTQPNNFRLICLNCDSQSPTFGAKNRGKGRKSRGMKQYD